MKIKRCRSNISTLISICNMSFRDIENSVSSELLDDVCQKLISEKIYWDIRQLHYHQIEKMCV